MGGANPASNPALRAIGLMAAWRRATATHMALSGGLACACGSPFDGLSGAALERDLVLYVYEKHRATHALRPVFEQAGCTDDDDCDLASLMRAITGASSSDEAAIQHLLDDLETAISGLSQSC
ncbi:hypothetical protein FOZ76_13470 [Verticiella sediminum]|uniref:Uncharacterized protein n=1 Tax=Verticiella sediminum TaxID=1247510 RepID=A0A556ALZ5_9BURK|nr:hypothetical protein [Verticiella sediminum]TSH93891.1 hypothetical protein FOZ76_13470 [Verticiella sediminum]